MVFMPDTRAATPPFDLVALEALVGPVAAREFQSAEETYRVDLFAWAQALPTLSDARLVNVAADAIYQSALVSRFRGNWEHEHFKASAAYFESARRKAAAHAEDCPATPLYERAYSRAVQDAGHSGLAEDLRACTCGRG